MPALRWVTGAILGSRRSNRWGPVWEGSEQRGVTQRGRRGEERAGVPRGLSGNSPHRDTGVGAQRRPPGPGAPEGGAEGEAGTSPEKGKRVSSPGNREHSGARGGSDQARSEEAGVLPGQRPRTPGCHAEQACARPRGSSKHMVGRNEAARMLGPRAGYGRKGSRGAALEGQ